jgi:hypothetical protein
MVDETTHKEKPVSACYRSVTPAFQHFLNRLQIPWRKTQRANLVDFASGVLATRGLPVRRVARALTGPVIAVRYTERRLRRFLGNERLDLDGGLTALLAFLLPRLGDLPFIPVVFDWTWVSRTHAVLWAQIPYHGRSFPLLASVHPAEEEHSTAHTLALLERLHAAWPAHLPRPLFLADGGFPYAAILQWLQEHGWHFLVRGRHDQHVYDQEGRRVDTTAVGLGDERYWTEVTVLGAARLPANVVVAGRKVRRRGVVKEARWLLITDLPSGDLPSATRLYAHRMQPEQTHRDCKRGHFVSGFALDHLERLRPDRLERALFCVGLCYAFLVFLAEAERNTRAWFRSRHWGLSLITLGLDLLHAGPGSAVQAIKRALACVDLNPLWLESGDS